MEMFTREEMDDVGRKRDKWQNECKFVYVQL